MFEVSSASSNTSLQSLWEVFHSLVDRSIWRVAPDNLKRFLQFGDCFQLCFKLAVSLQYCTHTRYSTGFRSGKFGGHWSLVKKSGHLAWSQFGRDPDYAKGPRERLEIQTWFQWTSNRKWPIEIRMITWLMTSRNPERSMSWPQYIWNTLSRQRLEMPIKHL